MVGQPGFSDMDDRRKRSSDHGDQLEACAGASDFEIFRADIVKALAYSDGSHGARPPCDVVLMFRILIIQAQDNPGDDRAGFLIPDRLSFMRFPGFGLHDRVPDAKTIRVFRERLTRAGAIKGLFSRFDAALREAGYIAMSGRIVASMLVTAPGQRNTVDGKTAVRMGKPGDENRPDDPAKAGQKDVDAHWTIQFAPVRQGAPARGRPTASRDTVNAWRSPGRARTRTAPRRPTSPSRVSDTRRIPASTSVSGSSGDGMSPVRRPMTGGCCAGGCWIATDTGSGVRADSACRSMKNEAFMERRGFVSHVHHRKPEGRPMPGNIRRGNSTRSKHRAPVEHVFAVRKHMIGMSTIACNIRRLVQFGGAVTA